MKRIYAYICTYIILHRSSIYVSRVLEGRLKDKDKSMNTEHELNKLIIVLCGMYFREIVNIYYTLYCTHICSVVSLLHRERKITSMYNYHFILL